MPDFNRAQFSHAPQAHTAPSTRGTVPGGFSDVPGPGGPQQLSLPTTAAAAFSHVSSPQTSGPASGSTAADFSHAPGTAAAIPRTSSIPFSPQFSSGNSGTTTQRPLSAGVPAASSLLSSGGRTGGSVPSAASLLSGTSTSAPTPSRPGVTDNTPPGPPPGPSGPGAVRTISAAQLAGRGGTGRTTLRPGNPGSPAANWPVPPTPPGQVRVATSSSSTVTPAVAPTARSRMSGFDAARVAGAGVNVVAKGLAGIEKRAASGGKPLFKSGGWRNT